MSEEGERPGVVPDVVVANGLVREFAAGGQSIRAVDGVDLTVAAGELLMVLGRSGAGKTTLLSLIGALDRPDSGTVTVAWERVDSFNTAQLDSETASGIMQLLREVAATGTAVLVATHDRVAVAVADRVVTKQDDRLAGPA